MQAMSGKWNLNSDSFSTMIQSFAQQDKIYFYSRHKSFSFIQFQNALWNTSKFGNVNELLVIHELWALNRKNHRTCLVSSGVISVGCKSTGAWDDVWVASTELSGAQRWINILRCWNDRLSVVAGESVIAIVLQSAPSTGDAFLGLRSPNFSCVQAEALMRSRRGPCTGARSTRTLTEARFSWWIHQVTRLAWAVSIAIVIARCCATIVARWAFGISVLAQSAAWFDSAWAAAIAARVTRWYI